MPGMRLVSCGHALLFASALNAQASTAPITPTTVITLHSRQVLRADGSGFREAVLELDGDRITAVREPRPGARVEPRRHRDSGSAGRARDYVTPSQS